MNAHDLSRLAVIVVMASSCLPEIRTVARDAAGDTGSDAGSDPFTPAVDAPPEVGRVDVGFARDTGRCEAALTACGPDCVSLQSSMNHCGGCGRACSLPGAEATCSQGRCELVRCLPGLADCDGQPLNGCEVDVRVNATHCGVCGNVCRFANGEGRCLSGSCGLARCETHFDNCDGIVGNGCESDLTTTVSHCGSCQTPCSLPNAISRCEASQCYFGSCRAGFGNCDLDTSNGCEVDLRINASHCGVCGHGCGGNESCVDGVCRSA